ncbi:glycerophosphodiester phosphodiesterase family protein [Kurthia sibirica]|uniref:GP-PDE domain-containing protein n=1 Tax=Kurthia sibirica TaxID=202750 RepID=A0A2U3APW1_9BACL|nr:glycerophosphodiester phosphodiesterase family protein [Kurthia sibirica]PWI26559.1 hypothetical protein DEX24_02000 [Kurthia sibirica]GEK32809.1 glycerophosphoryl diester phosphodiesterase [Kurthia sibirica]
MKIFAHRGASAHYPENTLPSFIAASKLAVEGVELDVQRTADGVLVIHHDERLHRTSNGSGFLRDYTFDQLRQLDFGSWKDDQFAATEIPTLREVLAVFKDTHHMINIELKTDVFEYKGIEDTVLQIVSEMGMSERIIYSSFDHCMVETMLKKAPKNEIGVLFEKILVNLHDYGEKIGSNQLHISLVAAKRGIMAASMAKGSIFRVYTVNKIADYDAMEELGVEAIFTDHPEKMLAHRHRKK